jgi:hypothetical protein
LRPSKLLVTPFWFWVTGTESAAGGLTFPFRTDEPPCGEFSSASTSVLLISSVPTTSPGLGARLDDVVAWVASGARAPMYRTIVWPDDAEASVATPTAAMVDASPTTQVTTNDVRERTPASPKSAQ